MCSHYESETRQDVLLQHFGTVVHGNLGTVDLWPRYQGFFLRKSLDGTNQDSSQHTTEALVGQWGLVSAQTKTPNPKLSTFNARSETADRLFNFRNAWHRAQLCIIPAKSIYEPDWRSGKAVPTRFTRTDGAPMGIAGLWDQWISPEGEVFHSYTMLTIPAHDHALFKHYHRPGKEKRQVVILEEGSYDDWLKCRTKDIREFLKPFPAALLQTH